MALPQPAAGQVIRYSYLWHNDALRGAEEGSKERPCAIVMMVTDEGGEQLVTVLPITHTPPQDSADALEIPRDTKRRLNLDSDRSWVVIAESNRFYWPGPDLRIARPGDASSAVYGLLPGNFFEEVRLAFLAKLRSARSSVVARTL